MNPQCAARVFCLAVLAMPVLPAPEGLALPQSPSTRKPAGLVVGQVVDAATGRPVPAATVTIAPAVTGADRMTTASPVSSPNRRVVADDQGRFLFRDLAKGTYLFSAAAPGYLNGGYGHRQPGGTTQPFALAEDERVGDVTVRLWKAATVGGTVSDDAGGPVVGVWVSIARREFAGGRVQLSVPESSWAYNARTDDRGAYQVSDLMPGEYLVSVATRTTAMPISLVDADTAALGSLRASGSNAMSMGMGAMSPGVRLGEFVVQTSDQGNRGGSNALAGRLPASTLPDGRIVAYPTTFHPSAISAAEATPITLQPGDERLDVDVRLRPLVMARVSGTVIGPNGPEPHFAVHLMPAYAAGQSLELTHEAAVTATDARGAFAFPGVPPGQYVVKAWRLPQILSIGRDSLPPDSTLWGEAPIGVGESALTGVTVNLQPGLTFSGRVEFDGAAQAPMPQQIQALLSVCFEPAWPLAAANRIATRVTAGGEFITQGVPPGRYVPRLPNQFSIRGWYFESATLDGKDLTAAPIMLESQNVSGILIKFSDRRTELTGRVQDASGKADPNATVIVFPADYQSWIQNGMHAPAARAVPTSQLGTYSVADIRPGEYLATAVGAELGGSWQQPAVIEALASRATRVTLARGETRRQDFRTRDAR
jgi:hypothetical protein